MLLSVTKCSVRHSTNYKGEEKHCDNNIIIMYVHFIIAIAQNNYKQQLLVLHNMSTCSKRINFCIIDKQRRGGTACDLLKYVNYNVKYYYRALLFYFKRFEHGYYHYQRHRLFHSYLLLFYEDN